MNDRTSSWELLHTHFAPARLRHYLRAADGDHSRAEALYQWNAEISGALQVALAHLEVALRNTIDAQLTRRHQRLGRDGHWIFDEHFEFGRDRAGGKDHRRPYVDVAEAERRVRRNRKPLDAGQMISEVSFGFWHQMVSRHQLAWWPDIAGGFPHAPSRDQALVHDPVSDLRQLRNRIGHHHRIWNTDLPRRYDQLLTLTGYISPDLATWIDASSPVREALARRPR
ncbi:MAG: hypothetical protein ACRCY8_12625 [Dermatophilaceae bacterium]